MFEISNVKTVDAKLISASSNGRTGKFVVVPSGWVLYVIFDGKCFCYYGWVAQSTPEERFLDHLARLTEKDFIENLCGNGSSIGQEDITSEKRLLEVAVLKARRHGKSREMCRKAFDFVRYSRFVSIDCFSSRFSGLLSQNELNGCMVYKKVDETNTLKSLFHSFQEQLKSEM